MEVVLILIISLVLLCLAYFIYSNKIQHDNDPIKEKETLIDIYKNKDVLILKQELEPEIYSQKHILCVGIRGDDSVIRGIKTDNGFISPLYGKEPKWTLSSDKKYVIISNIKIPIERARNTAYQCWLTRTNNSNKSVDGDEFNEHLIKLSQMK